MKANRPLIDGCLISDMLPLVAIEDQGAKTVFDDRLWGPEVKQILRGEVNCFFLLLYFE